MRPSRSAMRSAIFVVHQYVYGRRQQPTVAYDRPPRFAPSEPRDFGRPTEGLDPERAITVAKRPCQFAGSAAYSFTCQPLPVPE